MHRRVRVGIVSSYPPSRTPFAAGAAELARRLTTTDTSVVVCAVGRPDLSYPDEVVASVSVDDRADYRRGGRLLAEHGVDVAVIRLGDGVYGGAGGSHVRELSAELRRHGVIVMIVRPDNEGESAATLPADASAAAIVDETRPIRTDWLDRELLRVRSADPDRDARLAVVAARLLALPAGPLAPAGWATATAWAGRSVRALGGVVQPSATTAGSAGRAVFGLGAIASGRGVPDRLRHRAAVLRAMLLPACADGSLADAADVVFGLADDGRLTEPEWAALRSAAVRLDGARLAAGIGRSGSWPAFGERLRPGDIRLAHALVVAGSRLDDDAMLDRGLESVEWLAHRAGLAAVDGTFVSPLGGGDCSIEVANYVEALVAAYAETGAVRHARMAQRALAWFHGANPVSTDVYDEEAGACRGGIGPGVAVTALKTKATLAHLAATLALASVDLVRVPIAEVSRQDLATVA